MTQIGLFDSRLVDYVKESGIGHTGGSDHLVWIHFWQVQSTPRPYSRIHWILELMPSDCLQDESMVR